TKPHAPHPDVRGREVTTAPHFIQFRDWIVAQAASTGGRRVLNGTGAGILHGGRVEQADLGSLEFNELAQAGADLRRRLSHAWTTSTIGHATVRANLERAVADGAAIPFQKWAEFGGPSANIERLRETVQSTAACLAFDRRTAAYLGHLSESY